MRLPGRGGKRGGMGLHITKHQSLSLSTLAKLFILKLVILVNVNWIKNDILQRPAFSHLLPCSGPSFRRLGPFTTPDAAQRSAS